MSKHALDTLTTAVLRDLDPAPTTVLTDTELERADATLARILASPRDPHLHAESRRPRRLLVLVGLVAAAGAAVPALLLGGGSAFASWTPTPAPLTAVASSEAADTCRAALEVPDRGERVVSAERRGGWIYLLLAGPQAEAACLMPDDLVGQENPAEHTKRGFFGSYTTDPATAPTVAADGLDETESMEGSVPAPGRWPFRADDGWFRWVQGYVGSDVTGVTVHPPTGPAVEASLAHGRFAAWWPSERPSSKNPDAMGAWSYTVTLADGSTRRLTR